MTIRLEFVAETDAARLYRMRDGTQLWIPRSVVPSTTKFPPQDGKRIHELVIEDWWWDRHEQSVMGREDDPLDDVPSRRYDI